MSYLRFILALFLLADPSLAFGKHPAPPQVEAVTNNGVRYVVPNDKGLRAYVEAWDIQTGRKLWAATIFRHWYIPPFGTECAHFEYLTAITLRKDELKLTSERGRVYALDIRTRVVRRSKVQEPEKADSGSGEFASQATITYPPAGGIEKGVSEAPPNAKVVAGNYYCGDGLGYNVTITLKDNGKYKAEWHGCLGKYGVAVGSWELLGKSVLFTPTKETDLMKGHLKTLNVLRYNGGWIFVRAEDRDFYDKYGVSQFSCFQRDRF